MLVLQLLTLTTVAGVAVAQGEPALEALLQEEYGGTEGDRQLTLAPLPCAADTAGCCSDTKACLLRGGSCQDSSQSTEKCDALTLEAGLCDRKGCRCCADCSRSLADSECSRAKGQCRGLKQCRRYELTNTAASCSSRGCSCCTRCRTNDECRYGSHYGVCLPNAKFYVTNYPQFFLNSTARCPERGCSCLNLCPRDTTCSDKGGYCVHSQRDCKRGYVKNNCLCGSQCSCCVPGFEQLATDLC